jgi:hypothetical protein
MAHDGSSDSLVHLILFSHCIVPLLVISFIMNYLLPVPKKLSVACLQGYWTVRFLGSGHWPVRTFVGSRAVIPNHVCRVAKPRLVAETLSRYIHGP